MLSYQHSYHAGNLADVHKHALLAWMLDYMTRKPAPLSYIETHAGRGLYDLDGDAARKTGEAAQGIDRVAGWFDSAHPYVRALDAVRAHYGPRAYPGSPLLAAQLLRAEDRLDLAELHPAELTALRQSMAPCGARCHGRDGFELARALCPPTPRRGLLLIDPSYEIKSDYDALPGIIAGLVRVWNVGVICLWYPLLNAHSHTGMLDRLHDSHPDALRHEVRFAPARPGHGMVGSGLFVIRPPWGLADEAARLTGLFDRLAA